MSLLEKKVNNLKKALADKRNKEVVAFKYHEYMKVYDNAELNVVDKQNHRDLFADYLRYMYFDGRNPDGTLKR